MCKVNKPATPFVEDEKVFLIQKPQTLVLQRFAVVYRDPVGIRTQDPQLRRLLLYPTELPDQTVFGVQI